MQGAWEAAVDRDIKVWCDASSLAMGVVLEMSGKSGQGRVVAA